MYGLLEKYLYLRVNTQSFFDILCFTQYSNIIVI